MKIFKTRNLLIELGDWLSNNQTKLGQISYIGASKELWFKFEIAALMMDKWERVLNVPWHSYHMWVEIAQPDKGNNYIDMVVAPQRGGEIDWDKCGIVEFKTVGTRLAPDRRPSKTIASGVEADFEKREDYKFAEMIAVTLCNHYLEDDDDEIFSGEQEMIATVEKSLDDIVAAMQGAGLSMPHQTKKLPYAKSAFREDFHGFHSCGVWIKKAR